MMVARVPSVRDQLIKHVRRLRQMYLNASPEVRARYQHLVDCPENPGDLSNEDLMIWLGRLQASLRYARVTKLVQIQADLQEIGFSPEQIVDASKTLTEIDSLLRFKEQP